MFKWVFVLFFFLVTLFKVNCQLVKSEQKSQIEFEDFSYPLFLGGEQHSYFKASYPIANNLEIEFQNNYDTYLLTDRLRTSVSLKQYISDKIYFFGGVEFEFSRDEFFNIWDEKPRNSMNFGIGYNVSENFLIEAKANIQLNETTTGAFGEQLKPMKLFYTLGSKWKF